MNKLQKENSPKIMVPELIFMLEDRGLNDQAIINNLKITEQQLTKSRMTPEYLKLKEHEISIKQANVDLKRLKRVGKEGGILDQLMDSVENSLIPFITNSPELANPGLAILIKEVVGRVDKVAISVNNTINVAVKTQKEMATIEKKFTATNNERIDTLFNVSSDKIISEFVSALEDALSKAEIKAGIKSINV